MSDTYDINEFDEIIMRRALELAGRGAAFVSPNPMVGAIITDPDRNIVAEGWHQQFGGPHAEVMALQAVSGRDLAGHTLYVTLEPCNHHGKTPPCTQAILDSGIRRVVIGMRDPNPMVNGQGVRFLRGAGVEVVVGMLETRAQQLNEAYTRFITTGLPFVQVKLAQTLDGFIALPSGESQWITGELARRQVHYFRARTDSVMIGRGTAAKDDPSLRLRYGVEGRNPTRIIVDETLTLPASLKVFTDGYADTTLVFTSEALAESAQAKKLGSTGVRVFGVPMGLHNALRLDEVFRTLGELNVTSVLVEGGARLANSIVVQGLAQKIILFIAPKLFGHGLKPFEGLAVEHLADAKRVVIDSIEMVGEDMMVTAYWNEGVFDV